jgi:hypothetical protein
VDRIALEDSLPVPLSWPSSTTAEVLEKDRFGPLPMSQSLEVFWRKRVGVEPTILAAKDRINGFEGHENHRIPFASADDYRDGAPYVQLFAGIAGAFLRASSRSLG